MDLQTLLYTKMAGENQEAICAVTDFSSMKLSVYETIWNILKVSD